MVSHTTQSVGVSISVLLVSTHQAVLLLPTMTMQTQHLWLALRLWQNLLHLVLPGKMTQQKQQHLWLPNQPVAIKKPKTSLR
jgi:hypothetical protein